ncbi:hypothetical protein Tco_1115428 [Tanacetum coccineum]
MAGYTESMNKSKVIAPGVFKLDLEPVSPKLKKNKEAHVNYLKTTKNNVDTLRNIVEQARTSNPSDSALEYACVNKAVKSVNKKEWKPIGKIFTTVGHKWVPIGRTFTIVGNKCPLTRIASTKIVPPRKPVKSTNLGLLTTRNPTEFEDPTFQILYSLLMSDAGPKLQLLTPGYISLVLVENPYSSTPNVPPSEKDWDILF